jgi:hypothetical protein
MGFLNIGILILGMRITGILAVGVERMFSLARLILGMKRLRLTPAARKTLELWPVRMKYSATMFGSAGR